MPESARTEASAHAAPGTWAGGRREGRASRRLWLGVGEASASPRASPRSPRAGPPCGAAMRGRRRVVTWRSHRPLPAAPRNPFLWKLERRLLLSHTGGT